MRTFKKETGNPAAKQNNQLQTVTSGLPVFGDHGDYSNTNFDSENEECGPPQGEPRPNPNVRCTSSFQTIQEGMIWASRSPVKPPSLTSRRGDRSGLL